MTKPEMSEFFVWIEEFQKHLILKILKTKPLKSRKSPIFSLIFCSVVFRLLQQ